MIKKDIPVKYELTVILADGLNEDKKAAALDDLKKGIKDADGEVAKEEILGQRVLAYPIKKNHSGTYVTLYITILPAKVAKLEKEIHFVNEIIRHLLVTELRFSSHQLKMMAAREANAEIEKPERASKIIKTEAVPAGRQVKAEKEEKPATAPKEVVEDEKERQQKLDKKLEEILKE